MKILKIPKRLEIHAGGMDYNHAIGLVVLWGWNDEMPAPGCCHVIWRHWFHVFFDRDAWHYLAQNLKRLLPRISHG